MTRERRDRCVSNLS